MAQLSTEPFNLKSHSKAMAAAALIRDEAGALLIVKPTYRDGWLLPGGMVEPDESPKQACRREIEEEVGLELEVGRLLCVDYESKDLGGFERMRFFFGGGVITPAQTACIVLQESELSAHAFVTVSEALEKLNPFLSRRLQHALAAEQTGETLYVEDLERA